MDFFDKEVVSVEDKQIIFENGIMEVKKPKITAIDMNGKNQKVYLKDLKGSTLYNNKFFYEKENLMFQKENLYLVLTFKSLKKY